MTCIRCTRDIGDDAAYCPHCGADQRRTAPSEPRYLRRSRTERQIAGVCGGIARYFNIDPVLVRAAWVVFTIVPGAIFLGVLAYVGAWLVIPEAAPGADEAATSVSPTSSWRSRRLRRSTTDRQIAGVCGGIAEYFGVDATAVRVLWVVLSIFPGAIVCGALTYGVAWAIMPQASHSGAQASETAVPQRQPS